MQHRRRQHIFQAAKRAAFNHPIKTSAAARPEKTNTGPATSGR